MKKRIASFLLCFVLLLTTAAMAPTAAAAGSGLDNFQPVNNYEDARFRDVSSGAWYAEAVQTAYEYGLMNGTGNGRFNPDGNITTAEAVALASRIHHIYHGGDGVFQQGDPWYKVYENYARDNRILDNEVMEFMQVPITRNSFAYLLANAVPSSALKAINDVEKDSIPDLPSWTNEKKAAQVYRLYEAGVLTGNDSYGTFTPREPITRCAAAAIAARLIRPELRQEFQLQPYPITLENLQGRWGFRADNVWTREITIEGDHYQEAFIQEPTSNSPDYFVQYTSGTVTLDGYTLVVKGEKRSDSTDFGKETTNINDKYVALEFLTAPRGYQRLNHSLGLLEKSLQYLDGGTHPSLDVPAADLRSIALADLDHMNNEPRVLEPFVADKVYCGPFTSETSGHSYIVTVIKLKPGDPDQRAYVVTHDQQTGEVVYDAIQTYFSISNDEFGRTAIYYLKLWREFRDLSHSLDGLQFIC